MQEAAATPNRAQLHSSFSDVISSGNSAAPARTPFGVPDTRALPTEVRQRLDARGHANFVDEGLLYDDSKEQITASVDGFSVWLEADDGMVGYSVCVEGEQLATLRCPKKVPRKLLDKNYHVADTPPRLRRRRHTADQEWQRRAQRQLPRWQQVLV